MAIDYELNSQLKDLIEIKSHYLSWFFRLTQCLLFNQEQNDGLGLEQPSSYTRWYQEAIENSDTNQDLLLTLHARHQRLTKLSDKLLGDCIKTSKSISQDSYDKFSKLFEKFMDIIQRIERELILDEKGIDAETGLRRKAVLLADMNREMERLARQGKPFSLALVKVDHFDKIVEEEGKKASEYIKHLSRLIKKSIRSFDDAYRVGEGEFILSLKQADITGGIRALERLKELLEADIYNFASSSLDSKMISLSCCISEPLPYDDIDELINNMKKDFEAADKTEDSVLEYFELSPLQRYIKNS